jgi:hypothetical protein
MRWRVNDVGLVDDGQDRSAEPGLRAWTGGSRVDRPGGRRTACRGRPAGDGAAAPEQVQQDMAACQNSATQATGYSPSQQPVAAAPSGPSGKRLKGAAAGAVAGGVRAEARGNDSQAWDNADDDRKQDYRQDEAQASAKAGAAVGGMATRSDRRQGRREQGQQQQQASAWGQSYKSCLTSRGYAVTP